MRAFIAAPLQPVMTHRLMQMQQALTTALPSFRAMAWQNLHLTLVFLDDQSPEVLEETAKRMLSVGVGMKPFSAPLAGWQLLGRGQRRRPLCLEVAALPQLLELQRRLSDMTARLGIVSERRRYRPHLTLGRMPPPLPRQELLAPLLGEPPQRLEIDRIALYSSQLLPNGAEHKLLAEAGFNKAKGGNNRKTRTEGGADSNL